MRGENGGGENGPTRKGGGERGATVGDRTVTRKRTVIVFEVKRCANPRLNITSLDLSICHRRSIIVFLSVEMVAAIRRNRPRESSPGDIRNILFLGIHFLRSIPLVAAFPNS